MHKTQMQDVFLADTAVGGQACSLGRRRWFSRWRRGRWRCCGAKLQSEASKEQVRRCAHEFVTLAQDKALLGLCGQLVRHATMAWFDSLTSAWAASLVLLEGGALQEGLVHVGAM
jgi:hypothetical protein